jgi:hypothetical protein
VVTSTPFLFPLYTLHPLWQYHLNCTGRYMFGSWNPSQYKRFSQAASVLVKKAGGYAGLQGILCASSASLIIEVWDTATDDTATQAVQILDQTTLTAGQSYPIPAKINYGIYIKVISGTGKATVFFD